MANYYTFLTEKENMGEVFTFLLTKNTKACRSLSSISHNSLNPFLGGEYLVEKSKYKG